MFYFNLFQFALAVSSLSAVAASAPTQDNNPLLHKEVNYAGPSQNPEIGACVNLGKNADGLFHHLGSAEVPDGYTCSLFFGPDCKDAPICILSRSHPDLLTLEGNPCPNAMAFGVGYGVESVLCEDGN